MSSHLRTDYDSEGLGEELLAGTPYAQITAWVEQARQRHAERGDVPEPDALSVATVDADGLPDVRTVLMRFLDERGPGFLSNLESAKGRQIAATGVAAAALTWPSMFRAIRFRGRCVRLDPAEEQAYFVSRPWGSRISAWASAQSRPVASRSELEEQHARYAAAHPDRGRPDDVPYPPHWGGWRIVPDSVEFWAGRRDRLHDRLALTRTGEGTLADAGAWRVQRLQP